MNNIHDIRFYNERGNQNDVGYYVTVALKEEKEPTYEEENYIFDKLLINMRKSKSYIYYYIEFIYDGEWIHDSTSFELAKKLDRTQEIKDIVNEWLN
jgi:hypothetical protein